MRSKQSAFTLVELLAVIAIIAILAALLFPVFSRAKEAAKKTSCLANQKQISYAASMYLIDNDGVYPETKDPDSNPAKDDADGGLNEPDYGSFFTLVEPYVGKASLNKEKLFVCPSGQDPFGQDCLQFNPDIPALNSYIVNGYFVFGLNESTVTNPSAAILYGERRSETGEASQPYCDYVYYPWFNAQNSDAPEDDMDSSTGAFSTERHNGLSNFAFADGHVKSYPWGQTYSPPGINLHLVQ